MPIRDIHYKAYSGVDGSRVGYVRLLYYLRTELDTLEDLNEDEFYDKNSNVSKFR